LSVAREFLEGLELLASLRLCSNVAGQWAVQTALGGYQSIRELTAPGGRLYESRRVILESVASNPVFRLQKPDGALYAFVGIDRERVPAFDDQEFALELLERKHVLVAPGVSFNVGYNDHFRITNLPDAATLKTVFARMGELLSEYASRPARAGTVVEAGQRFRK
jgi:alanine-synthesizing transaminase